MAELTAAAGYPPEVQARALEVAANAEFAAVIADGLELAV
jgi:hypothetical protein